MRRSIVSALFAGMALAVCPGCAGTYDLLTSRRFRERPFETLFTSNDPMWVLENVAEGDERVRAIERLGEPRGDAERQKVVKILETSATEDRRPMCRLAAVTKLSEIDDPRSAAILVMAYRNAIYENPSETKSAGVIQPAGLRTGATVSSFTPDTIVTLRCLVLEALGKRRSPEGLALLCETALQPTESRNPTPAELLIATESDRIDVKMAAIRALAGYRKEPKAAEVLAQVMLKERDIAIRSRAYESLQEVTGQSHAIDSPEWTKWAGSTGSAASAATSTGGPRLPTAPSGGAPPMSPPLPTGGAVPIIPASGIATVNP